MRLITQKKVAFWTIVILTLQLVLVLESVVYSENDASEQSLDEIETTQLLNQTSAFNFEDQAFHQAQDIEEIQEFSFVAKTFRTTVNQPTILQFTSEIAANQVLVRIPPEGEIVEEQLDKGSSLVHSHGEYWNLHTSEEQTAFSLPVTFSIAGGYFLTVDNDADHFYLEVEESMQEKVEEPIETPNEADQSMSIEQEDFSLEKDSLMLEPVVAQEEHLSISEELMLAEDERILEKITDAEGRSSVSNWSTLRSAWNSSGTRTISVSGIIQQSTGLFSGLNTRSNDVTIRGSGSINFQSHNTENFRMSGTSTLTIENINIGSAASSTYRIDHSGTGKVVFTEFAREGSSHGSVRAQNILIERGSLISGEVVILSGGTLEIFSNGSNSPTGINTHNSPHLNPKIPHNAHIFIRGNDLHLKGFGVAGYNQTWDTVDVHLSGANSSTIISSNTTPDEFSERYFGLANMNRILLNAAGSEEWVTPPRPSYNLSLEASPSEGGLPTSLDTTISQGQTTVISANQNIGFDFVRWEISSGIGSSISNATSTTATFTMGTSDTTVRAIYQRKQGGEITVEYIDESMNQLAEKDVLNGLFDEVYETKPKEIDGYTLNEVPVNASGRFKEEAQTVTYKYKKDNLSPVLPMDPLNPEEEVNPENQPELPENQGALSIDFASQFDFGSQNISVQDKNYYAHPQRLLNEDGTVNEQEKRPNYVQISDRRSETDRNGWQLSVTQNSQFSTGSGKELSGARMRLTNQQLATAHGGTAPSLQQTEPLELVPGAKRVLLMAQGNEGTGTWIYRFGDANTAGNSVVIDVPKGANPEATSYSSTFTWELSAVPGN